MWHHPYSLVLRNITLISWLTGFVALSARFKAIVHHVSVVSVTLVLGYSQSAFFVRKQVYAFCWGIEKYEWVDQILASYKLFCHNVEFLLIFFIWGAYVQKKTYESRNHTFCNMNTIPGCKIPSTILSHTLAWQKLSRVCECRQKWKRSANSKDRRFESDRGGLKANWFSPRPIYEDLGLFYSLRSCFSFYHSTTACITYFDTCIRYAPALWHRDTGLPKSASAPRNDKTAAHYIIPWCE